VFALGDSAGVDDIRAGGRLPRPPAAPSGASGASPAPQPTCCPLYHDAVELIGRRWTGAILEVLLQGQALRFSEIAERVPALSDRLLSERVKELEARGLVRRTVQPGRPARVSYSLTEMGRALGPALGEVKAWAQRWLAVEGGPAQSSGPSAARARGD
jgi:DNA-binding HxlR family transcriptional regulator